MTVLNNRVVSSRRRRRRRHGAVNHEPRNGNKRSSPAGQTCRNCGGSYPHAGGREACPALGKSCSFCSKPNHFSKVCRSRQASQRPPSTPSTQAQPRRRRIRQIQQDDQDDDRYAAVGPAVDDTTQQGDDLVFSVDDHKPKQPTATVKVNGTFVRFIVDTGASVNIMEENVFAKLNPKPPLQRAPSSIYAYGSNTPMITLGAFHAEVETKNKLSEALIYVVRGKHWSLLSYLSYSFTARPDKT